MNSSLCLVLHTSVGESMCQTGLLQLLAWGLTDACHTPWDDDGDDAILLTFPFPDVMLPSFPGKRRRPN